MSEDLKYRPGGSLKLKGGDDSGKKKKQVILSINLEALSLNVLLIRSKRKNPSKVALTGNEPIKSDTLLKLTEGKDKPSKTQARDSPGAASGSQDNKTEAERRFEEAQRRRV